MKKLHCILLIDDDIDDNEFHEIVIHQADVCEHLRTAENGIQALEYLKKAANPALQQEYPKPDLVFLDINMPRMNGFEFLAAFHNLDEKERVPVVICMLTTSLNPDDKKRTMEISEVKDFYPKPLTAEMLRELLDKYFKE